MKAHQRSGQPVGPFLFGWSPVRSKSSTPLQKSSPLRSIIQHSRFRNFYLSPGCFCALISLVFCTAHIVFTFVQALLVGPLFSVYVGPFAFYLLILIHSSLLGRTQYVDMGGHLYTNNFDKKILDIMYIHLCILTIGLDFVHCSPNERNSPLLDQISHPSILGWPKKALHCRSAMRHTTRRTELEQMGSDPNLLLSSFSQ